MSNKNSNISIDSTTIDSTTIKVLPSTSTSTYAYTSSGQIYVGSPKNFNYSNNYYSGSTHTSISAIDLSDKFALIKRVSDHKLDGPAYEVQTTWRINGSDCPDYENEIFLKIVQIEDKKNLIEYLLDKNENIRLVAENRLKRLEDLEDEYNIQDYLIS